MTISDFDYVDPEKVRKNTAEFLARKPQVKSVRVIKTLENTYKVVK